MRGLCVPSTPVRLSASRGLACLGGEGWVAGALGAREQVLAARGAGLGILQAEDQPSFPRPHTRDLAVNVTQVASGKA